LAVHGDQDFGVPGEKCGHVCNRDSRGLSSSKKRALRELSLLTPAGSFRALNLSYIIFEELPSTFEYRYFKEYGDFNVGMVQKIAIK
jgi:hypothetical protein